MAVSKIYLPEMLSWKWIDDTEESILHDHVRSSSVDLISLLGYGALKRYSNNNLKKATELSLKLINHLPAEKSDILNKLLTEEEKRSLAPSLVSRTINAGKEAAALNALKLTHTFTPQQFYVACTGKMYETVKYMLRNGANPNQLNETGTSSILHYAASMEDEDLLDLLLGYHPDVNQQDEYGYTPLHWALAKKNLSFAKKLYENRADVSIANNDGDSVVTMALKYNQVALREPLCMLFNDFPYIYYMIQDNSLSKVIDEIYKAPDRYILQHDIGANPLEVPVLLHDKALAKIVRNGMSEQAFDEYFAKIKVKYPITSTAVFAVK